MVIPEQSENGFYKRLTGLFISFLLITSAVGAQEEVLLSKVQETKQMEYDYAFAEGLKYKMLGNPVEAGKQFNKCTSLLPEKSAPYYELGNLALAMKDSRAAEEYAKTAFGIDPQNEWYRFLLIQILLSDSRFSEAGDLYIGLQEQFPDKQEYLVAEIDLRIRAKDYKTAYKKLRELEKSSGYGTSVAMRRKDVYLAEGKDDKAIKELRHLVQIAPDEVEYRGILAELLVEKGRDEEALKEYQAIKDANSGNPIVYFSLGQYYMDKKQRHLAIEEFKIGFRSKQVSPEMKTAVFLELVRSETDPSKLSEDLQSLLQVLFESDEGNPGVDALFADYLYNQEDFKRAEDLYKRVVEGNPGNFAAWQNLLFIQNDQLDFTEMFKYGNQAALAFPNQALFFLFKGIGASGLKDYPAAVEALKKGARLNPNNSELTKQFYISLGDAYYRLGNYKEAFLNFDLLLLLEPDNLIVLNNYSYYLSVLNQNIDKAWKMISKCIAQEPNNSTYLDTQAWVLFRMEKYPEALEAVRKAVENETDTVSGEVWEHYGDILFKNGDLEKSLEMWEKARVAGDASDKIDEKISKRSLDE